ncbi:type IV pilus secretin PilQ [Tepidimonas taiwanensis]|uniref:Type IV pilus biogenesis and competence protein PilQ n=1 Tax=Tepidimonas taiwanensis TaxID=307486 RepID=A0A554XE38_9BURK|nr:type IV pilus secretin family protein [Tepidimonas taiwanensis]TSE34100.1 Type IV pilus biogenesis and competence protein PilQ [Tepidimonas taiwanensis]UBQ04926.1 type IV pilus secretin PilQ [Tepidimonas taiwanensis]
MIKEYPAVNRGVRRMRWLLGFTFAYVGLLASGMALAQPAIRAITASVAGDAEVVRIETTEPLSVAPASFAIQTPPRVSLDLPAVRNASGQSVIEVNQGVLRALRVLEAADRTRIVLNLNRSVPYETRVQGTTLLLTLRPADTPASVAAARSDNSPPTFDAGGGAGAAAAALRDIDFRRGDEGTGRVIVELANPQTSVDIRPQGRSLIVEFLRTSLPEGLRRRLDVADFGTPVRTITATQAGERVRLVVEPTGEWEHSAYQSDNRFVLEVRPVKADPNKLVQGPKYTGEKLSLNFQNIDVRSLLQVIADFTNFNIITSDAVQGNLTLRLKDVPWDQALDIILEAKGLGMTKTGNVIRVAPKKDLDAEALAQREVNKKLEELEPLRTEVFRLNFAKAEEVAKTLKDGVAAGAGDNQTTNRLLSSRGSVIADSRTNQLFVTDVSGRLDAVRDYIRRVDTSKRQVMIQARIVEAREGFGKTLGVRLGGADLRGVRGGDAGYSVGGNNRIAIGGSYDAVTATTRESAGALTNANTTFVNLPAKSDRVADVPKFALALFNPAANRFLNLEISALESDNQGRVVSSPRIVTGDLNKATIKQGDQLRFIRRRTNAQGQIEDVVETIDANLLLDVTPQITPSGQVLLKIKATKNRLIGITDAGPQLAVKEIDTEVMVENGGTVMIGGIFEQEETQSVDKVPVLGDVPVLGNLFKTRSNSAAKTETLIFITPVIVDDGGSSR